MAKKKKKTTKSAPAAPAAPKRSSSGGGKTTRRRRRAGGGRSGLTSNWDKTDLVIAMVTAAGVGYLQAKVADAVESDDMKWYKEMPVITPLGRTGTAALVAGGIAHFGKVRRAKGVALGLALATTMQLGRRKFDLYTEDELRTNMAGYDEAVLGGARDWLALGGEVDVDYED